MVLKTEKKQHHSFVWWSPCALVMYIYIIMYTYSTSSKFQHAVLPSKKCTSDSLHFPLSTISHCCWATQACCSLLTWEQRSAFWKLEVDISYLDIWERNTHVIGFDSKDLCCPGTCSEHRWCHQSIERNALAAKKNTRGVVVLMGRFRFKPSPNMDQMIFGHCNPLIIKIIPKYGQPRDMFHFRYPISPVGWFLATNIAYY